MRILALAAVAGLCRGNREVVNFDFAWRFQLDEAPPGPPAPPPPLPPPPPGPIPPARLESCQHCENGVNYGTGALATFHTANYTGCCDACASHPECKAWDWNPQQGACFIKDNATPKVKADRWSGVMPASATDSPDTSNSAAVAASGDPPNGPPVGPPPPQAAVGFDDSAWQLVDAPHDMLVNQNYDPKYTRGMGFLPRNSGWYRKHFTLPADWKGKSVWMYCEGSFHTTSAYINEDLVYYHQAGYTSFWIRLDNTTVKYGEPNVLALFVDASFGTGWWFEGGGLFRHQHLVATDTTHLEPDGTWTFAKDITGVAPRSGGSFGQFSAASATLVTSAEVTNHGKETSTVAVVATATDASGTVVGSSTAGILSVLAGKTVTTSSPLQVTNANVWSLQSPDQYTMTVSVHSGNEAGPVIDSYNYTVGIRTVEFDTKGLHLNGKPVKVRGFCDHSNFGGVGGAVPDRVNLYRAQMLRSVGGNAWRMAHNPPIPARLDFMDRLGMLALDENRDFGKVGDGDGEPLPAQLTDMRDLVKRDRSHPSVMAWSFCNEGECEVDADALPFRNVSYEFDGTRPVTQNHLSSTGVSIQYLDIQGFSHKSGSVFDTFHKAHPTKPMMATECCSCMSQRGVDQDACPKPKDGGCEGGAAAGLGPGVFYNNNIGQCTASQVMDSDSREFVAGTFVWSGFDYYGEARGFPQNTKCRGTVSDVAGFFKETSYWLRSWWLSNISDTDYGKPPLFWKPAVPDAATTVFVLEAWQPAPAVYNTLNRTINVYTNAPGVRLELNGRPITEVQAVPFFGQATFVVRYSPGNLTAVAVDEHLKPLATHSVLTPVGPAASVVLSLDAPSPLTGTGTHVVADGEDVAMVRATLLDAAGNFAYNSSANVTFSIVSGPGKIWATHNGDPASDSPRNVSWHAAYHGLARAFVRTTVDAATPLAHRRRLVEIDVESGAEGTVTVAADEAQPAVSDIVIKAEVEGAAPATLTIPVSTNAGDLPLAVASHYV